MILRPEIAALRGNDAPQRQAQDALHAAAAVWRRLPEVAPVLADFARFADGHALGNCPALTRLFVTSAPDAQRLVAGFTAHFGPALAANPLAHMPYRHFHDAATSTLALARSGPATLTLFATAGASLPALAAQRHASFWPGEAWEHFIAGHARGELVTRGAADHPPERSDLDIAPGLIVARRADREAVLLHPFAGLLVSLRLQRRHEGVETAEEVNLLTGDIVHRAAGRPRDSRLELMMAALGRMERHDAAPHFAAIACGEAGLGLRWQALRECLALDSATGLAALRALTACPTDPLSGVALTLQRDLVSRHPQLAEVA